MKKIIVITVKGDHKYQIGIEKAVAEVLSEIESSAGEFYQVLPECAIRIDQIVSVESFQINPESVGADK